VRVVDATGHPITVIWITKWAASNSDDLGYWLGVFAALTVIGQATLALAI